MNVNAQAEDVGTKQEKSRCKKKYNQQVVFQENIKYVITDMKAVEELPNREGKLVIHDVKTGKIFAFLT